MIDYVTSQVFRTVVVYCHLMTSGYFRLHTAHQKRRVKMQSENSVFSYIVVILHCVIFFDIKSCHIILCCRSRKR